MDYVKLKGTYDIPPDESDFYSFIEDKLGKILSDYGYKKVVFPVIEYANLFIRGVGDSSDIVVKKEMYVFEDRGHRQIALRPEGTASAVRLYLENGLSMQGYASRLYYSGPMFRAENPQAGRYRQFIQYGAEYLGDGNPFVDVELIKLNHDIFDQLGISDVTIYINSIGCRVCRPQHLENLKDYFSGKIGLMCEDCKKRFGSNPLRILDCKEEKCAPFLKDAPVMIDSLCTDCEAHFNSVKKGLEVLKIPYLIDPRLVRGLDYYNRTVFEVKASNAGAQSTVSAGGRYDYLIKDLGGMDTPAAGFAIGMERLALMLENRGPGKTGYYIPPTVYVAFIGEEFRMKALEIVSNLRKKNISAVTEYRYSSLKKHLKSADSMKAKYALFVGEDEVKKGIYTLRNLSNGDQSQGSLGEMAAVLK